MENPVELVVAAFPDEEQAGEVLDELKELEKMKFIGMWNAAVITKDAEGKLKLKETAEARGVRRGAGIGAIAGASSASWPVDPSAASCWARQPVRWVARSSTWVSATRSSRRWVS